MSEHPDCLSPLCDCMDGCVVQAVAAAARSAALEEAAKVADDYDDKHNYGDEGRYGKGAAEQIAAAIRGLKDK